MQMLYIVTLLFNFYAEYIMKNAGMEDTWAAIKIAGRKINKARYADDTTIMADVKRNGYVGELLELQQGCEGPFGSSRR